MRILFNRGGNRLAQEKSTRDVCLFKDGFRLTMLSVPRKLQAGLNRADRISRVASDSTSSDEKKHLCQVCETSGEMSHSAESGSASRVVSHCAS